jgi:excisionase family DNA binding protein
MNIPELAERLGISNCLAYKLIQQKLIAHSRIGARGRRGKIVISEDDLQRYLESVRVAPREEPASPPVKLRHLHV